WMPDRTCRAGHVAGSAPAPESRLAFDGSTPVVRTEVDGKPLDFVLDTGNQGGTQLWSRFGRDYAALIGARGRKETKRVEQIGGAREHEVVVIPELRVRLGALEAIIRPATIFPKPVGTDYQHGNLGMDVLSQAKDLTIDYRSMTVVTR